MNSATLLHLRPPFRAEHIGSLIRPTFLYEKRDLFTEKKCTLQELKVAEDEAIKQVVKLQQDIGIKTITDGELRRYPDYAWIKWGFSNVCLPLEACSSRGFLTHSMA